MQWINTVKVIDDEIIDKAMIFNLLNISYKY